MLFVYFQSVGNAGLCIHICACKETTGINVHACSEYMVGVQPSALAYYKCMLVSMPGQIDLSQSDSHKEIIYTIQHDTGRAWRPERRSPAAISGQFSGSRMTAASYSSTLMIRVAYETCQYSLVKVNGPLK